MLESCNSIFSDELTKISTTIYVTKAGNDLSGDGSFQFPFLTIQKGLSEAYNLYALPNEPQNNPSTYIRPAVWVGEGVYTENIILPPQVQLWGSGKDYCEIDGTIEIDNKWSNYVPINILNQSDLRSTIINFQVNGIVDIDFDLYESNQGRLTAYGCRFTNLFTISQKVSKVVGNSYKSVDCEYGNDVTFNGIPVLFKNTTMISWLGALLGSVTLNQVIGSASDNYFETCGGNLQDVIVNGTASVAPPYYLVFDHHLFPNAILTINGKYAQIKSSVYSIPETPNINLLSGAVVSQIFKFLPFPEPKANWTETDVNSPNYILNKPSLVGLPIVNQSVNSGVLATTTSATDVIVSLMTIPVSVTGTYLVFFSAEVQNSNGSAIMTFSVYANGVLITNSGRRFQKSSWGNVPLLCNAVILAGQNIDIRWKTSAGTASIQNRKIAIIKLS